MVGLRASVEELPGMVRYDYNEHKNQVYDGNQICYNLKPSNFFALKHCLGLNYFEKSFDSCGNCMVCRVVSFTA